MDLVIKHSERSYSRVQQSLVTRDTKQDGNAESAAVIKNGCQAGRLSVGSVVQRRRTQSEDDETGRGNPFTLTCNLNYKMLLQLQHHDAHHRE